MEIKPATLAQVRRGKDGRNMLVENDVLDIATRLLEIDPRLCLRFNEDGGYFVVYEREGDTERLVLTAQELDGRVLERVRQIAHPAYDYVGEADRLDDAAVKAADHRFAEQTGEIGERLAHAVRKDLQAKHRIIVPGEVV